MSQFSFDVSLADFEAQVLQASLQTPVVVDFWAPWCGPCQTLKPLLEKLAAEYRGRFLLAKVNSDENQELAAHFGVRSIPTVKVVYQGQLVDEFTGALPEGQLRAFLDRIALPGQAEAGLREQAAALEVVRRDRFFGEGAGRQTLLDFFTALAGGQHDDLVREFRRKLSATLN